MKRRKMRVTKLWLVSVSFLISWREVVRTRISFKAGEVNKAIHSSLANLSNIFFFNLKIIFCQIPYSIHKEFSLYLLQLE